jgi:hypothetical protein
MRHVTTLCLACLLSAALTGPAAAEYPMQCTGGGEMFANYYPEYRYIEIHFMKAPQGANYTAPGPGECAWMDRPLNEQEAFWFRYSLGGNQHIARFTFGPGGSSSEPLPSEVGGHAVGVIMEVSGSTLSQLIAAINSGRTFTVQAGGTDQGYFTVSQILF